MSLLGNRREIRHFTGLDDLYRAPDRPELILDPRALSVDQYVAAVLERVGGQSWPQERWIT